MAYIVVGIAFVDELNVRIGLLNPISYELVSIVWLHVYKAENVRPSKAYG